MNKILSAKYDIVFKKMFSDKNNVDLLKHFLSNILSLPIASITDIEVTNPEIVPDSKDGKIGQMDIRLKLNNCDVNVEMQLHSDTAFKERVLYYWAKLYSGDLKEGEGYSRLRRSISISIVNFNLFDCSDFHSVFKVREENRGELLTDKCEIHFFELKKTSRAINRNNMTELWLQLIKADSEEAFEMLSDTQVPEIKKAVNVIREMSEDEKVREMVRLREKTMRDEAARLEDAINQGREEGREEILGLLRAAGISDEQIKQLEKMRKDNR
ncbi:MAG: Rpn family recombination-promoting nuclease/putative transposase [Bacteroides sp.]|nr:Rpn family recombination-promoting nuclease/putative transposase [Bacteroides sp.]